MKKNYSFGFLMILSTLLLLLAITFMQCSPGVETPEDQPIRPLNKTEQSIVSSSLQFGLNLMKDIGKTETRKNIFISPLSISMAFGMALNGANNETYNEIKSVLGLNGLNQEEVNKSYKSLIELLQSIDRKVESRVANSIWYRKGFAVEKNFIDVNRNYFDALVQEADFGNPETVAIINNWVKQATNSKIEKIIDQIRFDVVMYLINAIYFKGPWKYRFEESNTLEDVFMVPDGRTVNCKMMRQKNDFRYFPETNYQAVDLAYGNGSYRMMVLLPNQQIPVETLVQNMNENEFNSIIKNLVEKKLLLMLPKFKLEYEIKLNDVLKQMGVVSAFDENRSDFSNISKTGRLYISEAKHKTYVDVNEEGTEAAAVTSIEISLTSTGGGDPIIKVDRPFMFIIYESNSNTILFIGKIINPSTN